MKIISMFIIALLLTVVFSACSTKTSVYESLYKEPNSEIENEKEYEIIIISSEIFDFDLITKYEFRVLDEDWNTIDIVIETPEDVRTISNFFKDAEIIVTDDWIVCDCPPDVVVRLLLSDGRNYRFFIERFHGGSLVLEYNMNGIFKWITFVNIAFDDFMSLILNFADTDLDEPHPLARALRDYMGGNIEVWNTYLEYRIPSDVVFAELVTLDDNGTMGVLLEIDCGAMHQVLLYVYDDELFYRLVGWSHYRAFGAGRYNRLMSGLYGGISVFSLESGSLVISTSWLDDTWDGYYYFFNSQPVTENEFNTLVMYAKVRYGVDGGWYDICCCNRYDRGDQTMQILAMTINCVPSLATINE